MKISVIIPTRNRIDLLRVCLDAISYDYQNSSSQVYEVIVTDDSENCVTKDVIESDYTWVRWVNGPKRGPAANRNNGVFFSKGDWLIFLDDDCIPDKNIINSYNNLFSSNLNLTVIEGLIFSDENFDILHTAPVNLTGGYLWSCNFAIKKTIFNKLNGFDENYKFPNLEDNDLYSRIKLANYNIIFNSEAKVYHPPRKISTPKKIALQHESWLYYHNKFNNNKTILDLIITILKFRFKRIFTAPINKLSMKFFLLTIQEIFYTIYYYFFLWNNTILNDANKKNY